MATQTDEQLIKEANLRREFRTIINAMDYFAKNPKGEVGYWGQPIDLYKKTRQITQRQKEDQNYNAVEYTNKNGKHIKFDKYKKICEHEILHKLKHNPELAEMMHNGKTVADYAMDADMYQVFCTSLQNKKLQKLTRTTSTNVFMRAILNDKPKYYKRLLNYPELVIDQDIHGRTALTLAIQNTIPDDFIKRLINTDPRILTLMYQKQNPAMIMLGVTKHIKSDVVLKESNRDKNFVKKYFDFIMRSTINNNVAVNQENENGNNILQLLQKEGYTQFTQIAQQKQKIGITSDAKQQIDVEQTQSEQQNIENEQMDEISQNQQ